jgi:hypothetical protein
MDSTGIISTGNPNLPDINTIMDNIIMDNVIVDNVMVADNVMVCDNIVSSPSIKRKHIENKKDYSKELERESLLEKEKEREREKKKKHIDTLPLYHSKFSVLILSHTTNRNTINKHKQMVDTILELYTNNGIHNVDTYTIKKAFEIETFNKTLLQYSIDCVLNVVNSRDIIFYHDKIRALISGVAFLSNLGLILGNGTYINCSDYLRMNEWPELIIKLVNNVYPIMKLHSSKDNIKCIQTIIDTMDKIDTMDTLDTNGILEYREIGDVIYNCMQTKICNIRKNETEIYLYEYIRPILITILQSF